jgi:hypothetical protein
MKPIGSEIITIQSKAASETGTQRGERGALTRSNSEQIAAWLAGKAPADMDAAAVSRASSHAVGLRVRYEGRFPTGPDGERLPSYQVAVGCEIQGEPEAVKAALHDLRNFMTPASVRDIEGWLARLSVIVAKRADDAFTEELRVVEYSSRLSRYPADVAYSVLLKSTWKFFPTWAELERAAEALTSPRRAMIAALERGPTPPEPKRRPATQEERDRIAALVAEMFPMRSPEMRAAAVDEMLKGDCMRDDA